MDTPTLLGTKARNLSLPLAFRWSNTVNNFLSGLDPVVIGTVVLPVGLVAAAWTLRMACAVCAVRVPDFMTAAAVIVVAVVSNIGIRIALNHNDMALGMGSQLLLVLLSSATIVSLSVRTSIASAIAVTITQVFFTGLLYFGATEIGQMLV